MTFDSRACVGEGERIDIQDRRSKVQTGGQPACAANAPDVKSGSNFPFTVLI